MSGLRYRTWGAAMKHFAALDVSLKQTSVCIVDDAGGIVREAKVATEPDDLRTFFRGTGLTFERIGLEAGPLSQWLHAGLTMAGLPAICVETRHAKAVLSGLANKTDRLDARGLAHMMRTGWYRPVHVKTVASQELRLLLTNRKLQVNKRVDIDSEIRGTLRGFGLKVGPVTPRQFEAQVRELVADRPQLLAVVEPVLRVRAVLISQYQVLHRMVLDAVRDDPVCRRLITVPGVGAVVALTYRATIDQPARFAKSKSVGASFGLTPRTYPSGETDRTGRISKAGDALTRAALYEAAHTMLMRVTKWSSLKAWAVRVASRRGRQKAMVALARRLAVVMHAMWRDGTEFRWTSRGDVAPAL